MISGLAVTTLDRYPAEHGSEEADRVRR
jgi:hypothetical protein